MPLTQTQLAAEVADRAEITKAEAKRVLEALEEVVLDEIENAEKVKIGGLVQLTVRVKPASKARKGRNPATGEEITIAAKPASVDLRARALTKAKGACRRRFRRHAGGSQGGLARHRRCALSARGVFASASPHRPSPACPEALTTVHRVKGRPCPRDRAPGQGGCGGAE